jgi:hypothetical protein
MLPINTVPDPGSLKRAVPSILQQATGLMNMGVPVEQVIEIHPNVAALWDEDVYSHSGVLSKWAVGMTHSVYMKGTNHSDRMRKATLVKLCTNRTQVTPSPAWVRCTSSGI